MISRCTTSNTEKCDDKIDVESQDLSVTLLNLRKGNPWNNSAVPMDTYNAGAVLKERSMSPKMRWKAMSNSTPRDTGTMKSFIATGDQCSANKNILRQLPKVLNNENIAAAVVASAMQESNITLPSRKQNNCHTNANARIKGCDPTNVRFG